MYKFLQRIFLVMLMCGLAVDVSAFVVDGIDYGLYYSDGHYSGVVVTRNQATLESEIEIPATITYEGVEYPVIKLEYGCFEGKSGLVSIKLPETITEIGGHAFYECVSLKSINIPSKVKTIDYNCFDSCGKITSFELPESLEFIGSYAFDNCTGLTSIIIPDNVTEIDYCAFHDCKNLTTVTLGKNVATMGSGVFSGAGLSILYVLAETPPVVDQYLGTRQATICVPEGSLEAYRSAPVWKESKIITLGEESIPGTTVYDGIVYKYDDTEKAYFVAPMEEGTDADYQNLENVVIPLVIKNEGIGYKVGGILENAFAGSSISSVVFPETFTTLPSGTFRNCRNLKKIEGTENLETLGDEVFAGCSSLENITLGKDIKTIGKNVFSGSGINILTMLAETPPSVNGTLGLPENATVFVPKNSVSLYKENGTAWYGLNILADTPHNRIPLLTVGSLTFKYVADSNAYFVAPQNEDENLNYTTLDDVVVPESIKVENVSYPVAGFIENAFAGSSLTSISFPSDFSDIPAGCFRNCSGLTKVEIPENIRSIGKDAYAGCINIKEIFVMSATPPALAESAFSEKTYEDADLYVFFTSLDIYKEASGWNKFNILVNERFETVRINNLTYLLNIDLLTGSVIEESSNGDNYTYYYEVKINIPEKVTYDGKEFKITAIAEGAFHDARITTLNIPASVVNCGPEAFANSNINTVSVASLDQWIDVFSSVADRPFSSYAGKLMIGNEYFKSVIITPDSKITETTFKGCLGITSLELTEGISEFSTRYDGCEEITLLIIPKDVTAISKNAVDYFTSLKKIIVKNPSAPSLPANSFKTEVTASAELVLSPFANNYTDAYSGWRLFKNISYFEVSIEEYPDFLFGRNKGAYATLVNKEVNGEVEIPALISGYNVSLEIMHADGFANCPNLTSITIPSTLKSIGTISNCPSLRKINLLYAQDQLNSNPAASLFCTLFTPSTSSAKSIFYTWPNLEVCVNDELLTDLVIPANITSFPHVFENYKSLKSLTIPGSVSSVSSNAFRGCSNLETLSIQPGEKDLNFGDNAFADTKISKLYLDRNVSGLSLPDVADLSFGNNVKNIGASLFENALNLKNIVLAENIQTIGTSAFAGCTGIDQVSFPAGINKIGSGAFKGCTALEKLIWNEPMANVEIYENAFNGCSSLKSLILPAGVSSIGNKAFAGCESLSEVNFDDSDTHIMLGGEIFAGAPLNELYLGRPVTLSTNTYLPFSDTDGKFNLTVNANVCKNLFRKANINLLKFGSNVSTIGDLAFFECSGINKLVIPSNISSVGGSAFEKCANIYEIEIEDSREPLSVNIGAFVNSAIENLYLGRTLKRDYSVNYFGGVFAYNPNLKSVELGQYATKIENYEFLNCQNLYSFTVGVGVREIEQYAVGYIPGSNGYIYDMLYFDKFVKTDIPKVIWLPNTRPQGYENLSGRINYVSQAAYNLPNQKEYRNLSSKFWVDGVLYVFNRQAADRTCVAIDCKYSPAYKETAVDSEVKYQNIMFTVEEINDYTFFNNEYIEKASIGNNIAHIGDYAFAGCSKLRAMFVPNSVLTLGEWAFSRCDAMESIVLGTGLKEIKDGCFSGDRKISEFMVPSNVSKIGNQVFDGCKGLSKLEIMNRKTELTLGYSSKNIDHSENPIPGRPLFADCELSEVYIGGNITYSATVEDGYSPFFRNDFLRKVTVFENETEVSDYEFYGCRNLKEVYIGNDVERIGNFAFSGCLDLDIFSIGNKVKYIGEDAFSDCGKMTLFTSHSTVPPVCGSQALDDINKFNCVLYVPSASVASYSAAEQWKNFFNIHPITEVAVPVTSISFDVKTLSLELGEQNLIEASVLPADASDARLIWESNNTEVAMVSQFGNVVAIGEGSCYITASTTDGSNLSASCFVTVTDNAGVLEVTVSDLGVIRNGNSISIVGAYDADKVSVFSVGGSMIYDGSDKRIENLPSGLYIVIVRNHVFKVMI